MLLTTILSISTFINIALAIVIFRNNNTKKDLQFKVKAIQGWADEAYKKIKKLEETRNSLLEHVSNLDSPQKKNGTRKKTRRSPKKK